METLKTVILSHYQECYMWVFLNQLDQELKVAQQQWRVHRRDLERHNLERHKLERHHLERHHLERHHLERHNLE